jgi:GAF domain
VSACPATPASAGGSDDLAARAAGLIAVAEDLVGEFSLRPLLERILRRCTELLGCDAGSICSVDEAAGTYHKEADIGVACQSGRVFPLTEGMTGAVVAHRGPLWFARYDDVPGGHVAPEERATLRGVIGVPLEWRGRIIGDVGPDVGLDLQPDGIGTLRQLPLGQRGLEQVQAGQAHQRVRRGRRVAALRSGDGRGHERDEHRSRAVSDLGRPADHGVDELFRGHERGTRERDD